MFKTFYFALVFLLLFQVAVSNSSKKQRINQQKGHSKRKLASGNYIALRYGDWSPYAGYLNHRFTNGARSGGDISSIKYANQYFSVNSRDLGVTEDYELEIHFNKQMTSINNYFNSGYDSYMSNIQYVDLSHFDSSELISAVQLFKGCSKLTSVNLKDFYAPKLTTINSMFINCGSLLSIDLSAVQSKSIVDYTNLFN